MEIHYEILTSTTRGPKIHSRVKKMEKRGWTCLTGCCKNPLCIFSTDECYVDYLNYRESCLTKLHAYKKKQLELKSRREQFYKKIYEMNTQLLFHFMYNEKARQNNNFERKHKAINFTNKKKQLVEIKYGKKNEKLTRRIKHSNVIEDRYVATKITT
jgi:hypothetical protein